MKKLFSLACAALLAVSANAAASEATGFVKEYGRLKLVGNQLSDANGKAVQLKGFSSFGWMSNWGDCWSDNAIQMMKQWGANMYRGAMYVGEGGYANNNQDNYTTETKNRIKKCWDAGLYYLCDWHVLTPGDPTDNTYSGAKTYFNEISKWAHSEGYTNVIYELCNEPNGVNWSKIKGYAEGLLPTIHANDPGAVVVVGTPQWDQQPEAAKDDRISTTDTRWNSLQIMYSFHYYACSHAQFEETFSNCCGSIPMFITEWGIADFSGGAGKRDVESHCYTNAISVMRIANGNNAGGQLVSWALWSLGEKNEQASVVTSCQSMSLSTTGKYVVENILGGCSLCKPKATACFMGTCQEISSSAASIIDLGKYDSDPEAEPVTGSAVLDKDFYGMSESVTYHEENTVADEQNKRSNCNGAYMWAGEDYNFRIDECVDASGCYGITNAEGWHNLGYIEPGEWEVYTVDVEKPGYYKIEMLVNPTTHQTLNISNTTYKYNQLVDYKKSTEDGSTIEKLDGISFDTNLPDKGNDNWKYWEWENPVDNLSNVEEISAAVLFKNDGKQTIKFSWLDGYIVNNVNLKDPANIHTSGDAGPIRLTYVKAYTGAPATVGTKEVKSEEYTIYPNPTSDVVYVSGEAQKIEVISLAGVVVASSNSNSVNIADAANGTYIAKALMADGTVVTKTIIKK